MINLRSKLHLALLGYFMKNPNAEQYLRELSRRLSFSVAHLSRELNKLSKQGLFLVRRAGREKYFRLNPSYKLLNELRGILSKL